MGGNGRSVPRGNTTYYLTQLRRSGDWRESVHPMSDMSTFAGQAEHYAAVRARLNNAPPPPPMAVRLQRRMYLLPKVRVRPKVTYGCPINLLAPAAAATIIRLVALRTGVSADDIIGPRRHRPIAAARKAAIKLVHSHCPHLSMPAIGRIFHRDHTTILFSLGRTARKSSYVPAANRVAPAIPYNAQERGLQTLKPESFRANQGTI